MSQVNDALKRIRDTQQGAPRTADAPAMRLPTPASASPPARGVGLILSIVFAVVALFGLIGLILLRELRQKQTAPIATANSAPAAAPMQTESGGTPKPVLPAPTAHKGSANGPIAAAPTQAVATSPAPVIKLQGILYTSQGSSAVISGQTVMAGDEVGGYRVTAIGQHSVTLVSGTRTNVLSLNR